MRAQNTFGQDFTTRWTTRSVFYPATIQTPPAITQRQITRRPHTARALEPNARLVLPIQHIIGDSATNYHRFCSAPTRFKIHPPTTALARSNHWSNHPQRHMRKPRLRRYADTWLRCKRNSVLRKSTEDIPLTFRKGLCRADRSIEQTKTSPGHAYDARRLQFGAIERPRPGQPPTLFFLPPTPYSHNLVPQRLPNLKIRRKSLADAPRIVDANARYL